ncbi:MAG: LytTR family transcriptional regulator [Bacteroidales bacterium]|nr:LytTR family transcriptional regulator [Bacteroidales bacterium]
MERIIIIEDRYCSEELRQFLDTHKQHVRLNSTVERLRSGSRFLFDEILGEVHGRSKLFIPGMEGYNVLRTSDIVRIEKTDKGVRLILGDQTEIETIQSLEQLEERLRHTRFLRIHRDHLVNMEFMVSCRLGEHPEIDLGIGGIVTVGHDMINNFLEFLQNIQ